MNESIEKQSDNTSKPWLWKKGQSGNLKGRPKGRTMKEYARVYLSKLTDEERDEWLEGLPKEIIWKMSEGNPEQKSDVTTMGKPIVVLASEIMEKNGITEDATPQSTESDSEGQSQV